MTGVPHAIDSIITSPNGSGQSIGKSSAYALPRKECLLLLATEFSDKFHQLMIEQWLNFIFHVFAIRIIDLSGNLDFHLCAFGYLDSFIDTLFRANPAQEGEIVPRPSPHLYRSSGSP
jgi:hypothetical protein